jgi:hypothetical protein
MWNVRRRIVDHRTGAAHSFVGSALVTAGNFLERGEIKVAGTTLQGSRSYKFQDEGSAVSIFFPDGRPFIRLTTATSQSVEHICGADHYAGRFFFKSEDVWVEAWRVRGPNKRYSSLSFNTRRPGYACAGPACRP